ncbi:hypothetical protein WJX81_004358 [Elliptochloris bilobata]|uniref:Protein kinase domain-containing protein n=1 Tax=Elliptochloris bilobata TaxID=381761 RepID=A0AAW1R1G5_9CHLO
MRDRQASRRLEEAQKTTARASTGRPRDPVHVPGGRKRHPPAQTGLRGILGRRAAQCCACTPATLSGDGEPAAQPPRAGSAAAAARAAAALETPLEGECWDDVGAGAESGAELAAQDALQRERAAAMQRERAVYQDAWDKGRTALLEEQALADATGAPDQQPAEPQAAEGDVHLELARMPQAQQRLADALEAQRAAGAQQELGFREIISGVRAWVEQDVGEVCLGEALGRGGCGSVALATATRLPGSFALKYAPPGMPNLDTRQAMLDNEATVQAATCLYALSAAGALTHGLLHAAMAHIVAALAHAHAHGVLHLDIKAENVLVFDAGGEIAFKLGDWGAAQLTSDPALACSIPSDIGTPAFMPPEQSAAAAHASAASDVFSAGAMAWALLTQRIPVPADGFLVRACDRPAQKVGPELGTWGPLVAGCTQRDPAMRWPLARVAAYLTQYGAELSSPAAEAEAAPLLAHWHAGGHHASSLVAAGGGGGGKNPAGVVLCLDAHAGGPRAPRPLQ